MRILDRYILKEFINPFLFGVCAFTAVFVGTGTLYRIAMMINEYGASLAAVSKVFVLALPSIIVLTFPMSVLLGSLMAFGSLSSSSEIIVMRAAGQHFVRLALPVFAVAFFISLGTTAFNEFVVPRANNAYNTIINEEIQHRAVPTSQEHIIIKNVQGDQISSLVYARQYDGKAKQFKDITVQAFENDRLVRVEKADRADWNGYKWLIHEGVLYDVSQGEESTRTLTFENQELPITQQPDKIYMEQKKPEELTIREIRMQIRLLEANHVDTNKLKVELYNRFALPLASLVCAFIGAPLGIQKQRGSSSIGFGISVVTIFIYYSIMTLTNSMGNGGVIPPVVAAFLPDIICGIVGIGLILRQVK
ncbi:LPS export ABC transporter permease LptG [Megasphaera hutchinsoni]|uniref:LPS export ABC transporter permease LptG n=1 Tax=Megasphaera hutchinsoni TaxID=1588748 RepID=A0A2J8BAP7_9FIRM|nr:LptF/LptG family permease [Megasphaera genomosp. type_2]PNH21816.1 LPS export ABC transporter permease LptG [Megasphaera genomosp. type_2]